MMSSGMSCDMSSGMRRVRIREKMAKRSKGQKVKNDILLFMSSRKIHRQ